MKVFKLDVDVGDGLMWVCIWIAIASIALGSVGMYHANKSPDVHCCVPEKYKTAADKLWLEVYREASGDTSIGYGSTSDYENEAVNAACGVPYIVKGDKLEIPDEYVPPTLPVEKEKETSKPSF